MRILLENNEFRRLLGIYALQGVLLEIYFAHQPTSVSAVHGIRPMKDGDLRENETKPRW